MQQRIINIAEGLAGNPARSMASPVSLSLCDGEQVVLLGPNAAGKSRLVDMLIGAVPLRGNALHYDFAPSDGLASDNIQYLAFSDAYGVSDENYYYQMRWNRQDLDEALPTVSDLLDRAFRMAERRRRMPERRASLRDRLCTLFGLDRHLDCQVVTLSSGELRKLYLARALLAMPRVLVLDNPFIGLDMAARSDLARLLTQLPDEFQILTILVLSRDDVLPEAVTHIVPVEHLQVLPKLPVRDYLAHRPAPVPPSDDFLREAIASLPEKDLSVVSFYPQGPSPEIVRCTQVSVRYDGRTILQPLDWVVREGECWALEGPNGSGKSTLLSLICADNPQGYACDIALFGRRRGTGESIWDIKRHIGYVSPELHRAFLSDVTCLELVASGHFDTVGLFRHPDEAQMAVSLHWMEIFGIAHLAERPYLRVSSGEQRLCLLARAFVKDPELLVLDEPMHGLDASNSLRAARIIDFFMQRPHKTLIMVTHFASELPACINHRLALRPAL
ncbi:MAG: ATP-binding cassette domain-containing protein [Bacteroidales bacterium]|nr:ATP-binding cassette domain-containing protein [Bacteroidales bacterium]